MRIPRAVSLAALGVAILVVLAAAAGGAGVSVADFYRGKTVRIVVGFVAGGGFDVYSRVIARHLGSHIPGHPAVIVENMPGAGSIVAANHVYTAAPRDGTVIGNVSGAIVLEQMFGSPGVRFDMTRLRHLGVPASDTFVMVATRSGGVARFDELLVRGRRPLVVGVIPGSTIGHIGILLRDVLGASLKLVAGYKGTADLRLAVETGEIEAFFTSWNSVRVTAPDKLRSGEWLVLAQLTDVAVDGLPAPRVPTILDLTRDEAQRRLLRLGIAAPGLFGKLYVLGPGVPTDRAAAVEAAFARTLADRGFLADAAQAGLEIRPLAGPETTALIREFLAMPPDLAVTLRARIREPSR